MNTAPKKIMFYVQHLLGIGHLARASLICQQFAGQGHDVTMVMGGAPVKGFPASTIKVLQLPVLKAGLKRFNDLTDEHGTIVGEDYKQKRRDMLLEFFDQYNPDILIIEAFPFGRRQMRFELIPLLEAARARKNKTLIAGSVRDIVQIKKKPERNFETVETIWKYYDLLLVHGDPNFVKLNQTFPLTDQIEDFIHYTGIVAGQVGELQGRSYDVVVSAGGGVVGEKIMLNAIKAKPLSKFSNASWCFLVGPNLSQDVREKLSAINDGSVTIENARPDFRALLAAAKLSISQAGYNTTADILQAGCASILVPYAEDGETEQTCRAEKLQTKGLVVVVREKDISPDKIATAIDSSVKHLKRDIEVPLNMDGAAQSVQILLNCL